MNVLEEIAPLIDVLLAIIKFIEAVDQKAQENPVIVKLQNVINELQAVGL